MLGDNGVVNPRELTLGPFDADAILDSRDHAKVATRATCEGIGDAVTEDSPDLRAALYDVVESRGHHADHRHLGRSDPDRLADNARIAAEPPLPDCVTQTDLARKP